MEEIQLCVFLWLNADSYNLVIHSGRKQAFIMSRGKKCIDPSFIKGTNLSFWNDIATATIEKKAFYFFDYIIGCNSFISLAKVVIMHNGERRLWLQASLGSNPASASYQLWIEGMLILLSLCFLNL